MEPGRGYGPVRSRGSLAVLVAGREGAGDSLGRGRQGWRPQEEMGIGPPSPSRQVEGRTLNTDGQGRGMMTSADLRGAGAFAF